MVRAFTPSAQTDTEEIKLRGKGREERTELERGIDDESLKYDGGFNNIGSSLTERRGREEDEDGEDKASGGERVGFRK